jgi:hypothetical protein
MDESEREQLAQRLSALSFSDARKEILRLDPDANLKYWRNAIWHEYHTLFLLPNAGLSITLVEEQEQKKTNELDDGAANPKRHKKIDVLYSYLEARVEPLTHRVKNSTGMV